MYRRIMAAIDGSETSEAALNEAAKLAREQQATLRLVHVVDMTSTYLNLATPSEIFQYQGALRDGGQKVLSDSRALVEQSEVSIETDLQIIEAPRNHTYEAIEAAAVRWPADLIVIGTHGRRGIRRFILGSTAEGLIRITTRPLLLIRTPG